MMMLFPGAVGIVAEDAVGVGYHVWLRDVCSATVRRPWDSRRSTPDLLTLSTYGIAALVAGGIAAKLGFFKGL